MEQYNVLSKGWLIDLGNSTLQTVYIDELINDTYTKKYNINNFPTDEHLENLTNVINYIYQPLCYHFGYKIPLKLSYVSEEYNKYLNLPYSNEMLVGLGLNIDIKSSLVNLTNKKIFDYIKNNLQFNKLIWILGNDYSPDNIFVSFLINDNNNEILRLKTNGGNYETFN